MPDDLTFLPPFDFHEHVIERWSGAAAHDTGLTVLMGFLVALELPVAITQMAFVAATVFALIVAFYKELLVVSFDPQLAASLGVRPRLVKYAMMAVLSLTVVAAFDAVGAVLVVAMLIAPAA